MTEIFDCGGGCGRSVKMFPGRKTRLCRRCAGAANSARPEVTAKKSAAMKRKFADDRFRDRHAERCSVAVRHRMETDPAFLQQRREAGQRLAKGGTGLDAQHLKWCPVEMRPAFKELVARGLSRTDARREIEKRIADKRARQGRKLTFEEQLEAVRQGAALVRKFVPITDAAPYTLGGVASGMI